MTMETGVPRIPSSLVIARVCEYLELTEAELKSRTRKKFIVYARGVVAVILREAGASYPWIAHRLGLKDHTSVMHLVKTYPDLATKYPHLAEAKAYGENARARKPIPINPLVLAQAGVIDVARAEPPKKKRTGRYVPDPLAINFASEDEDGDTCHAKRIRQKMIIGSALLLDAIKTARHA